MNPLSTSRNKYTKNVKDSTVYTPDGVVSFLEYILSPFMNKFFRVLDTSVGTGSLLRPFKELKLETWGYDIEDNKERKFCDHFIFKNFLSEENPIPGIDLVIQNPPFNTDRRNKEWLKSKKLGKALLPEVFTDKIFELYPGVSLISIQPMGFRLNQRIESKRWRKYWKSSNKISSIISLPLNIFKNVEFHVEIVCWNMPYLEGHYWFDPKFVN